MIPHSESIQIATNGNRRFDIFAYVYDVNTRYLVFFNLLRGFCVIIFSQRSVVYFRFVEDTERPLCDGAQPNEQSTISVKNTPGLTCSTFFDNSVSRERGLRADIINHIILPRDNCDSPRRRNTRVCGGVSDFQGKSSAAVGSVVAQSCLIVFWLFRFSGVSGIDFLGRRGLINRMIWIWKKCVANTKWVFFHT